MTEREADGALVECLDRAKQYPKMDREAVEWLADYAITLRGQLAVALDALRPLADTATWAESPDEKCPNRACGIGCDMGGAGPGPNGEHDPGCCLKAAQKVLADIKSAEEEK